MEGGFRHGPPWRNSMSAKIESASFVIRNVLPARFVRPRRIGCMPGVSEPAPGHPDVHEGFPP
ncbi:hypothetical protein BCEP4_220080 [Burkholderia cepacia]|nr:hypothetical protein BCEP4_220080 [Burkholderia cepacia]